MALSVACNPYSELGPSQLLLAKVKNAAKQDWYLNIKINPNPYATVEY